MFYIYCILNTVNAKVYIGKTNDLTKRWQDHKKISNGSKKLYPRSYSIIHSAIAKYGLDKFEFYLVQCFNLEKDSYEAEKYWISFYNSCNRKFGYNISIGGIGSGSYLNSPNFGLKRSELTISKLKISHLGNRNINFGRKFSNKTKEKMSNSRRGNYTGEENSNSVLTWELVADIRLCYARGMNPTELSKKFNTSRPNIYAIVNNKTWALKDKK